MRKPQWLAILLFVLSLIYLIPEVVFNAQLVTVAGGGGMDDALLHSTELFGRWISGIGVTLLVADLLLKGPLVRSTWRCIASFVVIAALVWPTVFFGQKWLVDSAFIDPSTSEQRQEAFFSSILRSSLAINALNIKGLPYDPEHASSPEEMTFLAVMGGMVYANSEFIDHAESQKSVILARYLINRAGVDFPQHYGQYKTMRNEVVASWQTYNAGVKGYDKALRSATPEANKAWEQVESDIVSGWKSYNQKQQTYALRAETRAQKIAPLIFAHHQDSNRCISSYGQSKNYHEARLQRCKNDEISQYKRTLQKYDIPYVDMDHWLRKEIGREQGTTSWSESMSTLGLSAVLAGLEMAVGKSGEREITYIYTNEVAFYTPRILALMTPAFLRETGFPKGIANTQTFRNHSTTAKEIIASSAKKGIKLPKNWRVKDINTFKNAVKKKVRSQATASWKREINKQDLSIAPYLTWSKFQIQPEIQARIKAQMGEGYYVSPMLASWNNKQFYNNVIKVNIAKEHAHWLSYLEAARSQFDDGGPLAEQGKSALRSIIIPPISMSLSLLLILLTVVKLPFKFWHLIDYNSGHEPGSKFERHIGSMLSASLMLAVFIVPLVFGSSKFTSQQSTANYFLKKFDETVSPVGSVVVKWILYTQPMVQPVGAAFDDNMQIIAKFEHFLEPRLARLDKQVITVEDPAMLVSLQQQKSALKKDGKLVYLPFSVTTNVKNANIRVMNIKDRYSPAMQLPLGNYDVEVSALGHRTERRWVTHQQGRNVHGFMLDPQR